MPDDTDDRKAAEILAPEREPDRAEQAALDCIDTQRWVLWRADDYAAAVIRMLSRAGLLRDRNREAELKDADLVMRRLADEANTDLRRQISAALAEIGRLRAALTAPAEGTTTPARETA